jgi:hypothetical protein
MSQLGHFCRLGGLQARGKIVENQQVDFDAPAAVNVTATGEILSVRHKYAKLRNRDWAS